MRSICPFCCLGCNLQLIVDKGAIVGIEYLSEGPNEGALCTRGNTSYEIAQHPDRLATPLIRSDGGFKEVSWSDALKFLSEKLLKIKSEHGPRSIGVIASARTSNEDCYVTQKFARTVLETPNIDNPARLTHAATLSSLAKNLKYPWATCTLDLIEETDFILIAGANPFEVNPVLTRRILRARDGGAIIVVVDPRRTKTTWKSDLHLQVKPESDPELFLSMLNVISSSKLIKDEAWKVEGFQETVKLAEEYIPENVEAKVGISSKLIRETALRLALSKRPIIIFSHGLTQQRRALAALRALVVLSRAVGVFSNGGLIPLTDQNNMQGSCDMGCLAEYGPGYTLVEKGLTITEMIETAAKGDLKALIVIGFNLVASLPDRRFIEDALRRLDLLVVMDLFPTDTTKLAHVVLPICSWAEYDGTYTNIEGRVQRSFKAIEPLNEAKPLWLILSELARIMGAKGFNYSSWIDVFKEITLTVDQYSKLTIEGVSVIGGQLVKKEIKGITSLKELKSEPESPEEASNKFVLIAGRGIHHLDTGDLTRRLSFASKEVPEPYLEISQEDALELNLKDGDVVEVKGPKGSLRVKVKVAPKGLRGVVFMPIHFPSCSPLSIANFKVHEETKAPLIKHFMVEITR
ncbi:MAG: molybdopterin-dependent oxidoreductase [Candidatus Nezhaarchaeales archaeon]